SNPGNNAGCQPIVTQLSLHEFTEHFDPPGFRQIGLIAEWAIRKRLLDRFCGPCFVGLCCLPAGAHPPRCWPPRVSHCSRIRRRMRSLKRLSFGRPPRKKSRRTSHANPQARSKLKKNKKAAAFSIVTTTAELTAQRRCSLRLNGVFSMK